MNQNADIKRAPKLEPLRLRIFRKHIDFTRTVKYKCDPTGGRLNCFRTTAKILRVEMLVVTSSDTAAKLVLKT